MPPLRSLLRAGRLVSGLGGGAIGAATAEPDESALMRGLGGAALGGLVLPGAIGSAARGFRRPVPLPKGQTGTRRGGFGEALADYTYFGFLGSPDTMARASLGGAGGALLGALEMMGEGALKGDLDLLKRSGRVMKHLVGPGKDDGPRSWARHVFVESPEEFSKQYQRIAPTVQDPTAPEHYQRAQGWLGKFYGASDLVAMEALGKGGMSAQEAARYTLTGEPVSRTGQWALKAQREGRKLGGLPGFVSTQLAPFARVGIMGLEKGLEHTPALGFAAHRSFQRTAAKARAPILKRIDQLQKDRTGAVDRLQAALTDPQRKAARTRLQSIEQRITRENEKLARHTLPKASVQKQITQQALGAGAGAAGYAGRDKIDPRVGLVLGPLAGPAFVPYMAGREAKQQAERGEFSAGQLIGEVLKETSPLGAQPAALFYRPGREAARRFIPSGVSDIAEAMDPAFGRESGTAAVRDAVERGEIERPPLGTSGVASAIQARIPGLREALPETFMPTDVFGDPRWASPEVFGSPGPGGEPHDVLRGLSRALFPSRESVMPPALNQTDPRQALLRNLGLRPGSPSTRVTLPGLNVPLQQTPASAAAVAKHRGFARELATNILSQMPQLQQMPDGPQKQLLARRLFEAIQGRISRALAAGTLPLALSQGATLPDWLSEQP
mgnify:CR=1 FL=1